MRFSQRYGYSQVRDNLQLESMDQPLRNSLWNQVERYYWFSSAIVPDEFLIREFCARVWSDYFKEPLNKMPRSLGDNKRVIFAFFENARWYEVYDFVEFIIQETPSFPLSDRPDLFRKDVNKVLKREASGYRLVGQHIVPIVEQTEVDEVESALLSNLQSVSEHLKRALEFLSDRQSPDYRNSVKESISAVEGQVRDALGEEKGTLGKLLEQLDQKKSIHPALKGAFERLYGYTSDESGIRHALIEGSREVTFQEAKFMLVACSAFVNYIRESG